MIIKKFLSEQKKEYLTRKRLKQVGSFEHYFPKDCTIISNNCLGGFIYQDLNISYNSPTIGLYFFFPDYIEFLSDLKGNLEADIQFVSASKYEVGNMRIRKSKHPYPIGLLKGKFEIHFLHYKTQTEVIEKWGRRLKRVNWVKGLIELKSRLIIPRYRDMITHNCHRRWRSIAHPPRRGRLFL